MALLACGSSPEQALRNPLVGWGQERVKVGQAGELRLADAVAARADEADLRQSLADRRKAARRRWEEAPAEASALGLARAWYPELTAAQAELGEEGAASSPRLPLSPDLALQVRLPDAEGGDMELATRGYVFRVREQAPRRGKPMRAQEGAAFYGRERFWMALGDKSVDEAGRWVAHRVEEFAILAEGAGEHRVRYEVELPEGVVAARDVGDHLELLVQGDRPVLRLHYLVARDGSGLSRQGEVYLGGVARADGRPDRHALRSRTLEVEMAVSLEGMTGPVVVDPGWSSTASMAYNRKWHTATLLPDGRVLVTGGHSGAAYLASAELHDPETATWSSTTSMSQARGYHTATLLHSGKVLVAGGANGSLLTTVELYDPVTRLWSPADVMSYARHIHTATLLPDGRVLVVGGNNGSALSTAELYEPSTRSWSPARSMNASRYYHTATFLPNGKVLVAGGHEGSSSLSTAELYDPATDTWATTGGLATGRYYHTATLLPNGKVLATGGWTGSFTSTAELYNLTTGTWSSTGSLSLGRYSHTATLLPDGKVLVTGGYYYNYPYYSPPWYRCTNSAELYDPATGTWSNTGALSDISVYHTATLLPSGELLVAGGYYHYNTNTATTNTTQRYDPALERWSSGGSMAEARAGHTTTLLPSGQVLVVGGSGETGELPTAELYGPVSGLWSSTSSMSSPRSEHTATLLPSGQVLLAGGSSMGMVLDSATLYDAPTASWTATGLMAGARKGHTATLLPSGQVLVTGGTAGGGNPLASAELYDLATGQWMSTGQMNVARTGHTATMLTSGRVLVTGGSNGSAAMAAAELYEPATGTWSVTTSMTAARSSHSATLLPSGRVLVVAGQGASGPLASAELYEPTTAQWTATGSMVLVRASHTATLLHSGKVLIAGGTSGAGAFYASVELYDPLLGTWRAVQAMVAPRTGHTATLLPSGKVLVAGGQNDVPVATVEVYDETQANEAWRPVVELPQALQPGASITVSGALLRGISTGSSGQAQDSAANFPLLRLRSLDSGAVTWMVGRDSSDAAVTTTVPSVMDGHYLLLATVNGITGGRVVRVSGSNGVPVARNVSRGTLRGNAVTVSLDATDPDGDELTYAVVQGPSSGTLAGGGASLVYTPTAGFSGTDTFTYQAHDGLASSNVATVTVWVGNTAPVASAVAATTSKGKPVAVTLSGTDADGDALVYWMMSYPWYGTLSGTAPHFTYTPSAGYVGSDSFSYMAFDGTATSALATASLTVVNLAPVAWDFSAQTTADQQVTVTLSAGDADGDALTYMVVAAPQHGSLSGTPPHLVYAPAPGYLGADSFTFRASDGSASSNTATASLTISTPPPNAAPSVPVLGTPADGAMLAEGAVTFTWEASTDSDGEAVTYRLELLQDASVLASFISTSTSLVLADQLGAGSYGWRVEAVDARGLGSGLSATASFTVDGGQPTAMGLDAPEKDEPSQLGCSASGSTAWPPWLGVGVLLLLVTGRRPHRSRPYLASTPATMSSATTMPMRLSPAMRPELTGTT